MSVTIGVDSATSRRARGARWAAGAAAARGARPSDSYAAVRTSCLRPQERAADVHQVHDDCRLQDDNTAEPEQERANEEEVDVNKEQAQGQHEKEAPDVGYTQGMNFFTVILLAHMNTEDAFWFLVDLVDSLPDGFLQRATLDEVELFEDIVSFHAPLIREHLEAGDACPGDVQRAMSYLLVQWMMPLFAHVLPLVSTLAIWDFLFDVKTHHHSDSLILNMHRIAFALLEVHAGPLLSRHRAAAQAIAALSNHDQRKEPVQEENVMRLNETLDRTTGIKFFFDVFGLCWSPSKATG
ncbi:TBC1 domain family member 8 [Hondaea fermentalgiana]|uniref:TBC1 domain family member 8 n=1 Tax=Hondaea fermentalgiana TaxID=2315210 RepID=A0A2R5GAC7_9STRA|nr:TBC1 domain family member 8 [Hondaea fermentalgiana]|eukprot:GBG27970.1 TBC1 domain family member 8 [Hondaea fermentalgiana]